MKYVISGQSSLCVGGSEVQTSKTAVLFENVTVTVQIPVHFLWFLV
jgi:hypothetical protein